ncbi:carbamoyl-phosphate synthase arginine-specific large chain, partial [Metarhizium brunneum ARSEF 3297]
MKRKERIDAAITRFGVHGPTLYSHGTGQHVVRASYGVLRTCPEMLACAVQLAHLNRTWMTSELASGVAHASIDDASLPPIAGTIWASFYEQAGIDRRLGIAINKEKDGVGFILDAELAAHFPLYDCAAWSGFTHLMRQPTQVFLSMLLSFPDPQQEILPTICRHLVRQRH